MDDEYSQYAIPDYVLISTWIEIGACALVVLACLALVRRGPLPALLGALGALAAGATAALGLAALLDAEALDRSELFWQAVTYARSIGLAVLGVALVLTLLRIRQAR